MNEVVIEIKGKKKARKQGLRMRDPNQQNAKSEGRSKWAIER